MVRCVAVWLVGDVAPPSEVKAGGEMYAWKGPAMRPLDFGGYFVNHELPVWVNMVLLVS